MKNYESAEQSTLKNSLTWNKMKLVLKKPKKKTPKVRSALMSTAISQRISWDVLKPKVIA